MFPGFNPSTLEFTPDERQLDTANGRIPVWMYTPAIDGELIVLAQRAVMRKV